MELLETFFEDTEKPQFESVPNKFESFTQYRDIWISLFLYETYNQMINQRTMADKDRELLQAQGIQVKENNKQYFEGGIQMSHKDGKYIYLNLFEQEWPSADKFGNYTLRTIDSLKEFDLLIISEQPLASKDIKKITNVQYLLEMKK